MPLVRRRGRAASALVSALRTARTLATSGSGSGSASRRLRLRLRAPASGTLPALRPGERDRPTRDRAESSAE